MRPCQLCQKIPCICPREAMTRKSDSAPDVQQQARELCEKLTGKKDGGFSGLPCATCQEAESALLAARQQGIEETVLKIEAARDDIATPQSFARSWVMWKRTGRLEGMTEAANIGRALLERDEKKS